jgi:hypothetical protein
MKRFLITALATLLVYGLATAGRANAQDAKAILDKAIKALGGADKLGKVDAYILKATGKITFGDNENTFTSVMTVQGLGRYRSEFDGQFNGNAVKGVTVLNGDKGWRKFGDNLREMDTDAVANEKRAVYLQVIPVTLVPLKGNGFKFEAAGEEKVGDRPALVLKVTGPEGKDFKLSFDKENGLPIKLVATVMGFQGQEFTQETTFGDYKDFDGIKKATKVESKRDGQKFLEQEITDFKVVDKVDPEAFAEVK